MTAALRVDRRAIAVTQGDPEVFADSGISKADIVERYQRVASHVLPHVRGRPVMMQRFPGADGNAPVYQKVMPSHFPDRTHPVTLPKVGGPVTHVAVDEAAALVCIANQGPITPHVWLSRVAHLDGPDRMIIDLSNPALAVRLALASPHT